MTFSLSSAVTSNADQFNSLSMNSWFCFSRKMKPKLIMSRTFHYRYRWPKFYNFLKWHTESIDFALRLKGKSSRSWMYKNVELLNIIELSSNYFFMMSKKYLLWFVKGRFQACNFKFLFFGFSAPVYTGYYWKYFISYIFW